MTDLKTLNDIIVKDNARSGPLTPENRVTYNSELGEPKFYRAYKASDDSLRSAAKEWCDKIRKAVNDDRPLDNKPFWLKDKEVLGASWKGHYLSILVWIEHFFNLEED